MYARISTLDYRDMQEIGYFHKLLAFLCDMCIKKIDLTSDQKLNSLIISSHLSQVIRINKFINQGTREATDLGLNIQSSPNI